MADDDALNDAEIDALFARAKAGKVDMNGITRRVLATLAQMRDELRTYRRNTLPTMPDKET